MKTCQHCQTELTNPRAKNCAECSAILSEANRAGSYGFVMEALAVAKAAGLTGADVHEAMRAASRAGQSEHNRIADEIRARAKQRAAERSAEIARYQVTGRWASSEHPDNEDVLSTHDAALRGLDAQNILDIHPQED